MKQIVLFIFLFVAFGSNAQTTIYHPFPDSNAYWNFHIEYFCFPVQNNVIDHYSIEIGTDTLIGGSVYHKLQTPFLIPMQSYYMIQGLPIHSMQYKKVITATPSTGFVFQNGVQILRAQVAAYKQKMRSQEKYKAMSVHAVYRPL